MFSKQSFAPDFSHARNAVPSWTGASSGLGESTAKLLARHGAKVVLGARRKERIDGVVKEISAAIKGAVDVTKRTEVEALIKEPSTCSDGSTSW